MFLLGVSCFEMNDVVDVTSCDYSILNVVIQTLLF
jgi:hypothetical protein